MEIYKDLNSKALKEFESLLSTHQKSEGILKEGTVLKGKITKVTSKHVFLHLPSSKSEAILNISELKELGLEEKIKLNEEIECYIENVEDREGNLKVSASRAVKLKGWEKILEKFEKKEPISGIVHSRVKGGVVVQEIESKSLLFCPSSQLDLVPTKDISHLQKTPLQFLILRVDKSRGNALCSRREILNSKLKESKEIILKKYNVGDRVTGRCKNISNFGIFFEVNGEIDVLCHLSDVAWSRIDSAHDFININDERELLIIAKDESKMQLSTSIKRLTPDPFLNISKYELNKPYPCRIVKILEWGMFCELPEPGLTALLHSSQCDHLKKNPNLKKKYSVGQEIMCHIIDINTELRRVSLSHKATKISPFEELKNKIGTNFDATVVSKNDFSLLVKLSKDIEPLSFVHKNDLSHSFDSDSDLEKYKVSDNITVKLVEVDASKGSVRSSRKALEKDPFDFFKDRNLKVNDVLTCEIISSNNQTGITVKPEGYKGPPILIKKNQIAINIQDARASRFVGGIGERIDVAIKEYSYSKKKISLSIKLLEEIQKKEALKKYGSDESSGKQLPFSTLDKSIKEAKDKKKGKKE